MTSWRERQAAEEKLPTVLFRDLAVGDEFDFVPPNRSHASFFLTCTKTGPRSYTYVKENPSFHPYYPGNHVYKKHVSTDNVEVYHVVRKRRAGNKRPRKAGRSSRRGGRGRTSRGSRR